MQDFDCLDSNGKIIGQVSATDGNTAWVLARAAHPTVACLRSTVLPKAKAA